MSKNIAIRDAYGEALRELGGINEKVIALEADIGNSSKSLLCGAAYPERYFNVGISELNMVNMSAGLALSLIHSLLKEKGAGLLILSIPIIKFSQSK